MILQDLGAAVRRARSARGLTQEALAAKAGLSRNTVNRLESGLFPDLGLNKAEAILEELGMELSLKPIDPKSKAPDFAAMASASASVSLKKQLTPKELVHALLSGKVPQGKEAHFIVLLDEAPSSMLKGLLNQVGALTKPGKVEKNLSKIAHQLGMDSESATWQKKIA